jgi:toxin ParE1/3/4
MRYSTQVKPISYLKANAAEVLTQLAERREPMVITQNGEAIHDYITESDSVAKANNVLDAVMHVVESLSRFPERGTYPRELVGLGIKEYRSTFFKPYRAVYRVIGSQVIIYLIADGRREMQTVLARRLLGT